MDHTWEQFFEKVYLLFIPVLNTFVIFLLLAEKPIKTISKKWDNFKTKKVFGGNHETKN
jgi:hypothetical protein